MSRNNVLHIIGWILVVAVTFPLIACQSERTVDPTESLIIQQTENLFTRIKVRDYAAIWENEFAYMRDESPLEEYLKNPYMKWYQPDTLMAVQVDSVSIFGDTAYAHMMVEWLLSDSTFSVDTIRLRWYYSDDEWIKPQLSDLGRQLEFEEELRVYWEAVRQMQEDEEEENSGESGDE